MNGKAHVERIADDATEAAWDGACSASVLADLVSDCIFVVDERLCIVYANKAFLSTFGCVTRESVCGRSLCAVADCRHAGGDGTCGGPACQDCAWVLAIESCGQKGVRERELRILKRNGDALDFAVRVAYSGIAALRVCGLKDLYAAKRLRVMERAFFHDVTNLAAGIRGLCEMSDQEDGGQDVELQGLIRDSACKLVDEIGRLRTLRVAENGDLRLWLSAFSPYAVLQDVAERFRGEASARHTALVLEGLCAPPSVETDKALLAMVLGELARNAIEASVRGGRVMFSCSTEDGHAVFRVHTPAVLDEGVRAHVFERSFTTKGSGRGIGAYLAKLLAERHLKGTLKFLSQEPDGTAFCLRIPVILSNATA